MWVPSLFLCSFSVFQERRRRRRAAAAAAKWFNRLRPPSFPGLLGRSDAPQGERRKGRGRKCSPPPMHCFLLDPQYANGIAGSFPLGIILGKCRHSRRFTGFFFLGYLEALAAHVAFTLSSRGLSLPLPFPPPATWGLEEEVASVSFPPRYSLLPHRFITSNAVNASARGTAGRRGISPKYQRSHFPKKANTGLCKEVVICPTILVCHFPENNSCQSLAQNTRAKQQAKIERAYRNTGVGGWRG